MMKLNGFIVFTIFYACNSFSEVRGPFLETSEISVGTNHVCAITSGGTKCFGNAEARTTNVPSDLKELNQLQVGNRFSCALTSKGIRCWGEIPGTSKNDILIGRKELKNPRLLAVGFEHACAVGDRDQIKCWGKNESGEGSPPPELKNISEISLGMTNSCAIANSKVVCWGLKSTGSLQVPENLINPKNLTSGWWHHCVQSDEGLKCWGHPFNGSVSPEDAMVTNVTSGGLLNCGLSTTGVKCWDETGKIFLLPESVDVKSIKLGSSFVCGLSELHGVMCWAPRSGVFKRMRSFVPAGGIAHIEKLAAGNAGTCAYGDNDDVRCWGTNPDGSLDIPKQIPGPLFTFSLGARRLCAISKEGAKCFGGQSLEFDIPKNIGKVSMITSGGYQICAADTTKATCWGEDIRDALNVPKNLTQISQISSGFTHACAIANNEVVCWGGTGLIKGVNPVKKMKNPKSICAGGTFSCGIDEKGKVACWGKKIPLANHLGKELFGANTTAVLRIPRQISDAIEVSCGLSHACAIYKGQLKCWGDKGVRGEKLSPKTLIKNPRQLAAGWNHTCAMGDNGLNCWGEGINLEMPKYSLEK